MNTVNINSDNFIITKEYETYINNNTGYGFLKIRAYAASEAVPISNLKIEVSTIISNTKYIFYEGLTDNSGLIEEITLPAPKKDPDNLEVPSSTVYQVLATKENIKESFDINIYDGISVIQTISIVPPMKGMM
jgi:hypothetical protein